MKRSRRGTDSRTRISCIECRKRHVKCDGQQPCQKCWQDNLSCSYNALAPFRAKQWDPREAGLPDLPPPSEPVKRASRLSFVSENERVESRYEVIESQPKPRSTIYDTAGLSSPATSRDGPWASPSSSKAGIPTRMPITDLTEAFFLERYCRIIGPWFDMFDMKCNWSRNVPHLALSNISLFRAIIASCAKQYSLVARESSIFALDYYNHALKELTQALDDPQLIGSPAVFASCLLTGYCEMIDAKSLDWHTHLRGTFSLCASQGWHGLCGGVGQSCFWVYCRMDLLASVARAEKTSLDTTMWLPEGGSLRPADPRQQWEPDSWCNQVVLLLAETHNLLCDARQSSHQSTNQPYLLDRWRKLSANLSEHESGRPPSLHPIIHLPPEGRSCPFERLIYASPAACAATQMLEVASLLLLVASPNHGPAERQNRSVADEVSERALALSRKIVSNSITNRLTIAWANAVQLLATAGLVLVAEDERAALVTILEDIKSETGWSVEGHIQSLNSWWNSIDLRFNQVYGAAVEGTSSEDVLLKRVGDCLVTLVTETMTYT
ncbi:fungal-specific transcription factor domain-containing protein [Exophiala viscosa]|uniref:Fungal-specific transcription factor domain-containing protein n=1 Tax=Exophiala viscosa TaxID=2486360 RepID=A0AAN6IDA2_9EURO|nr:fungal-specific transcription factor domain-containing protein [Exophiala viscosa]